MGKNQSEGLLLEATLGSPVFIEKTSQKLTYAYFLFGRHCEILATLLTLFAPVCMKKDKDLPWAIRIFRWGAVGLALSYAVLCLIEKFREVFP